MQRLHVVISGRVQGVAFRAATRRTALLKNLTGWVRNSPDGSVEAVFEGKEADVADMLAWCRRGPPASRVSLVAVTEEQYTGEFAEFTIRF